MKDGLIVVSAAKDLFPEKDKILRCIHFAGGNIDVKMNYRAYFSEECSDYIASLLK